MPPPAPISLCKSLLGRSLRRPPPPRPHSSSPSSFSSLSPSRHPLNPRPQRPRDPAPFRRSPVSDAGPARRWLGTEPGAGPVAPPPPPEEYDAEVDAINLKFAEAREEIDMAMESKETVYFDEEAECARAAVKEVVDRFEGLLRRLPEAEKAALRRSMGLKMEQLKAELEQLND
ncbi:ETS domain-containing transcription factor ERF [Eucalyptus grandis]|uniref:ETS domain-containing transcription factor ERF n=1 Tax=Eucalyptus grandis TaxID=71139 RepID=UPI00192ED86D|nr:ETS domain-containing transcription factor ERF [Eucalyptus grandis]